MSIIEKPKAQINPLDKTNLYVCIPIELLLNPPIKHRNSTKAEFVTPFEFAVCAGVLVAAWAVQSALRHDQALEGGQEMIDSERADNERFRDDWKLAKRQRRMGGDAPTPTRHHTFESKARHKPIPLQKAVKAAGKHGYKDARQALARNVPKTIMVQSTRRSLIQYARLPAGGYHMSRLNGALDRLTQPVGELEPLLRSWRLLPNGRLGLEVRGSWLEPPYGRIPLPLPTSSAALALQLFVQAINTGPLNKQGMAFPKLCERLGIPKWWPSTQRKALYAARDCLNEHLAKVIDRKLLPHDLVPHSYDVEHDDVDMVYIKSIKRHLSDDEHDAVRRKKRATKPKISEEQLRRQVAEDERLAKEHRRAELVAQKRDKELEREGWFDDPDGE